MHVHLIVPTRPISFDSRWDDPGLHPNGVGETLVPLETLENVTDVGGKGEMQPHRRANRWRANLGGGDLQIGDAESGR